MRFVSVVLLISTMPACASPARDTLTVFAASSLSAAFEDIVARFEQENPDVEVVLNLAGSQTLATQIANGAKADVFASADAEQMRRAVDEAPADIGPSQFATNQLSIVVAEGNPKRLQSLADLARDDVAIVLGAEEVPVGRYAIEALTTAGVEVQASSYELDVGLVLAKVSLGEADAGIVYRSDLLRAGDGVEGIEIPPAFNVEAVYPIAAWQHDGIREGLASEFIRFVMSDEGQGALRRAGFGK